MNELQTYLGWPLDDVKSALAGRAHCVIRLTMPARILRYDPRLRKLRVVRIRENGQKNGLPVVEIVVGSFADTPIENGNTIK